MWYELSRLGFQPHFAKYSTSFSTPHLWNGPFHLLALSLHYHLFCESHFSNPSQLALSLGSFLWLLLPALVVPLWLFSTSLWWFEVHACRVVSDWLFVTPWTVAHQAPLSMGFSRQEYWSGLSLPPSGELPGPGIKPTSPMLAGGFFTS